MATTIKLKNSVTTTNAPSSLVQGEVAINITDKKVWVGNAATTPIQLLGAGASGTFGALTCTSLTNSGLTSGRVTYASTGGLLADSANFTFNGTTVTMANDASISGLTVGKGGGALTGNTVVGNIAMPSNTTGSYNSAFGYGALYVNTTGSYNTAIGRETLKTVTTNQQNTAVGALALALTTADSNTAVGAFAMQTNSTGANNTAVGMQALNSNTTASNNTAVGYQAGYSNTTGTVITAIGRVALFSNTTGVANTALGNAALFTNTTGGNNTAIGDNALLSNTTASNNTAVGYQALYSNQTGTGITALGVQAGYSSVNSANTGYNTFIGRQSGYSLTTGVDTVFVGNVAGYSTTTGSENTAVGSVSLYNNTTGAKNVAFGRESLFSNTTASNNTAVGYQAGYSQTGNYGANTYFGYRSGYSTTTGGGNTLIGYQAGYSLTTGNGNTFIGPNYNVNGAGYAMTNGSLNTIIGGFSGNQGGLDIRTASNYIVLSDGDGNPRGYFDNNGQFIVQNDNANIVCLKGYATNASYTGIIADVWADRNTTNGSFTAIRYYNIGAGQTKLEVLDSGTVNNRTGTYGTLSDAKLKENIVDATPKLDKIKQLQVRNYNLIGDDLKQIGFVAQEFERVFPSMVAETSDKDKDGNDLGTKTKYIKTSVLVPILVKAVQELTAKVEALEAQLNK